MDKPGSKKIIGVFFSMKCHVHMTMKLEHKVMSFYDLKCRKG